MVRIAGRWRHAILARMSENDRYDPERHHRQSMRASWWDYAAGGSYFVTICTQHRLTVFGEVLPEDGGSMRLSPAGEMVAHRWLTLGTRFSFAEVDAFVVMPNHLHGIITVRSTVAPIPERTRVPDTRANGTLAGSIGRIIQAFKLETTVAYICAVQHDGSEPFDGRLWQRDYHDHVIRDAADLERVRSYIGANPQRWLTDTLHPSNIDRKHPTRLEPPPQNGSTRSGT